MEQSEINYLRLVAVIFGPGNAAVRALFDSHFPPNLLQLQVSTVLKSRLENMKNRKILKSSEWDTLFPNNGTDLSSRDFDLSLMVCLLRHLGFNKRQQPANGYDVLPNETDTKPADDVARIKFYRNLIVHSNDRKLQDEYYRQVFDNICRAVFRLGGREMEEECETLGRADLNLSYRQSCEELLRGLRAIANLDTRQERVENDLTVHESFMRQQAAITRKIITDIRQNKQKNKAVDDRINKLKEELKTMKEKLYSTTNILPLNVKRQLVRQIDCWIQDDRNYIPTKATEDALKTARAHHVLTVTGNGGCGKTALIRHIGLQLMSEGYELIPVIEPYGILEYHDDEKRQVFVLDDACGVHAIDTRKRISWNDYEKTIIESLTQSNGILLVSVRLALFNQEQFKNIKILNKYHINLKDTNYALSFQEKVDIFRCYFQSEFPQIQLTDQISTLHDCFPLLCRLAPDKLKAFTTDDSKSNKNKLFEFVESLFSSPTDFFEKELTTLQNESPIQLCALLVLVLFNGKIDMTLDINFKENKKLLKDCFDACKLNRGTSVKRLREEILNLDGVYVLVTNGQVTFVHDIVMDAVSLFCGIHFPDLVLNHGSLDLIRDRIRFEGLGNFDKNSCSILISFDHLVEFCQRMWEEMERGRASELYGHPQLASEKLQTKLVQFFDTKDTTQLIETLFKTKDILHDRHKKSRLKILDFSIAFVCQKVINMEIEPFLYITAENSIDWIIGKGLNVLLSYINKRFKKLVSPSNAKRTFLSICSGDVKTYKILNNCAEHKKKIQTDLKLAIVFGRADIAAYLIKRDGRENINTEPVILLPLFFDLFFPRVIRLTHWMLKSKLVVMILKLLRPEFAAICDRIIDTDGVVKSYCEFSSFLFLPDDDSFNRVILKKVLTDLIPFVEQRMSQQNEYSHFKRQKLTTFYEAFKDGHHVRKSYLEIASELGHTAIVDLLLENGAAANIVHFRKEDFVLNSEMGN